MKNIVSMRKDIYKYKVIILDVDGTLYSQPKLRLGMALNLGLYYLCHPFRIRELLILKKYRSVREEWPDVPAIQSEDLDGSGSSSIEEAQYQYVARLLGLPPRKVREVVYHWIHQRPLALLPKCKDTQLLSLIEKLRTGPVTIAVYSDYPAEEKLKALGLQVSHIFCSSDSDINCMKPERKAMEVILKKLDTAPEEALMIGDRFSRDGLAAKNIGMDYVVLAKSMPLRAKLYQSL